MGLSYYRNKLVSLRVIMGKFGSHISAVGKAVWRWLKRVNPFLLFAILFLIKIIIPSNTSVWTQLKYSRTLDKQEREIRELKREIEKTKVAKKDLWIERDRLEKFARERYLMKEEDEEIYLLK